MKTLIVYALLFCASAGFVGSRVHTLRNQKPRHFEIVEDLSLSHADGCESLLGLAEQTLHANGVSSGSTLTVLVIGDEATANEPVQLSRYSIPTSRKVLEGRNANVRRRQELLQDLSKKCRMARRTTVSPIFLGVKQAVDDLRAMGCNQNTRCQLFVDSDLEENVEISIKKSIDSIDGRKRSLPYYLENEGVSVTFCGLAVTAGHIADLSGREIRKALPHNASREDRLRQTWLSLFTRPEAVNVEPYCPKTLDLETHEQMPSANKGSASILPKVGSE